MHALSCWVGRAWHTWKIVIKRVRKNPTGAFVPRSTAAGFKVRKGDSFVIECSYTTINTNSTSPTKFGMASSDEMCVDFIGHYPLQKASGCQFSRGSNKGKGKENPKALPYSGINRVFGYVLTGLKLFMFLVYRKQICLTVS